MPRISAPPKPVPAGCLALFGLVFLITGLCLLWFLGFKPAARIYAVRSWDSVPCVIKKAGLKLVPRPNQKPQAVPDALYEFTWQGKPVTGSAVYDSGMPDSVSGLEEDLAAIRASPHPSCLVNPARPEEAVLLPPPWPGAVAGISAGTVFSLAGLAILGRGLFRKRPAATPEDSAAGTNCSPVAGPLLFTAVTAGGIFCLIKAARDDWKTTAARMQEAPCTILHSAVKRQTSNSGRGNSVTYRPEIIFRYEWQGRTWHSDRPDFTLAGYSSSNQQDTQDVVRRHPRGTAQHCWVDPLRPWVAVLDKTARGKWLFWILGGLFGALGLFGTVYNVLKGTLPALRRRRIPPPLPPA